MLEKFLALRAAADDTSGASSWSDLGEKVAEVGGDTLTWDGGKDGRLIWANGNLIKISDAVITAEELKNGYKLFGKNSRGVYEEKEFNLSEDADYYEGAINICEGTVFCVYSDGFELMGETAPETGVYMIAVTAPFAPYSLIIPGYTGFVTKQTVIKPIDTKYLPEHLQFGETIVKGDTLKWDGNTDGKATMEAPEILGYFVKISDAIPSLDDCKNGMVVTCVDGSCATLSKGDLDEIYNTIGVVGSQLGAYVIPSDGFVLMDTFTFPESGVWVAYMEGMPYVTSLTIPGYGGFESKTVTPMDAKYMPDSVGTVKTINGQAPDENGNVTIEIPDPGSGGGNASAIPDDEMLDFLMEMDIVQPLSNTNNAVYTDSNNNLYVL